jgi:hypothetical protein
MRFLVRIIAVASISAAFFAGCTVDRTATTAGPAAPGASGASQAEAGVDPSGAAGAGNSSGSGGYGGNAGAGAGNGSAGEQVGGSGGAGMGGAGTGGIGGTSGTGGVSGEPSQAGTGGTVSPPGTCEPGHYPGLFDGLYSPSMIGLPMIPCNGTLSLNLVDGPAPEILEATDGLFGGIAVGFFPMEGTAHGTLDCSTGMFEGVMEGSYSYQQYRYDFQGVVRAIYSKDRHAFINGVWSVVETYPDGGISYGQPLPVQPGQPLPIIPPGFSGGVGQWTATKTQ